MPHDIIDNRDEKLADAIRKILGSTDSARFAVGYFFLSGLEAIQDKLTGVTKLKLLIGNTTNRKTIEQISEGYKRLELVEASEERERYLKKADKKLRSEETAGNLRQSVEIMDQTDDGENLIKNLIQLIEEKRLEVKVYTRGRLHAKAYIFDYGEDNYEDGIAVIGSSNLTLSGISHNTELNVVVQGNENHERLGKWFDDLWEEAEDFEAHLMEELKQSWAASLATPYDIYMKSIYCLVADRLEEDDRTILWDNEISRSLADFQIDAVKRAIRMIRDWGGTFVADVVGLGKSYIGAGIVKYFEHTENARPLIICPKPLEDMWDQYNEKFELNARILPMSLLKEGADNILDGPKYKNRNFILIDESHNFRNFTSQRYQILQDYLARDGRKVCLLTATPRNRDALDIYNQIKLFHQDDITHLPIDPPNLKQYFKQIENGAKRVQDLLVHLLIRRTRRNVLRFYGYTEDTDVPMKTLSEAKAKKYLNGPKRAYVKVAGGKHFFPKRELKTLRYSIEKTYSGLYEQIRCCLGRPAGAALTSNPDAELTYARYGLWNYVKPAMNNLAPYKDLQSAGRNLRGLIRVSMFKRLESSVEAFRQTVTRMQSAHEIFLKSLDKGFVPAGEDAAKHLYHSDKHEEADLLRLLKQSSDKYKLADFNEPLLRKDIQNDLDLLTKILKLVMPISPGKDDKLQTLIAGLKKNIPQKTGKVLIFSQFSDTVAYLHDNLNPGGQHDDIDCIFGNDKSKALMAARFSPQTNREIPRGADRELKILISTDVMSEGLNLQDGDVVLNYDLHWNPVRLIQRFGRIDRIGSKNDKIRGFNFLPETAMEQQLGLQQVLETRIREIHESIGEDAAILDNSEQINEDGMYCIYEEKNGQLGLFEDNEDDLLNINEAEELLRSLKAEDPEEYERIANLRDGIRSARATISADGERYIFCQAGNFQQLFLLDKEGEIISRDVSKILPRLQCQKNEPASSLPAGYNDSVMKVLEVFKKEAAERSAQQKFSLNLTRAQRYIIAELRACRTSPEVEESDELRSQINLLEDSFKQSLTAAIKKQINVIRNNGITGGQLVELLSDIYHSHNMDKHSYFQDRQTKEESDNLPRIICSEAFL